MRLVTRAEWEARSPRYINEVQLTAQSTGHWNGLKVLVDGNLTWDHSKCASIVRGIQNFHMDSRGWPDIAYNFMICPHGYTFEGRGLNVRNAANGTNAGNNSSHAVMCLAGQDNPFPESEKIEFRECVKYVSDNTLAPDSCIGHRDHKPTECPGNERYNWIHQGMPVPQPQPQPPSEDDVITATYMKRQSSGAVVAHFSDGRNVPINLAEGMGFRTFEEIYVVTLGVDLVNYTTTTLIHDGEVQRPVWSIGDNTADILGLPT